MTLITITNELPISFFCGCSQSCQSMISFGTVRLSEMKNKNINHGSIKPSRDLLKNEKEESYVNTTE